VKSIRSVLRCGALVVPILLFFVSFPALATVKYRISLGQPDKHLFHVTMTVPVENEDLVVAMPAWNALYQIRDFSSRVRTGPVFTTVGGTKRYGVVEELDKQTWQLCRCASLHERPQTITFGYAIEWNEAGPFDSQLNAHHAFLNFAEVLMYVPDRRAEDVEVQFDNLPAGWKLIAELPAGPNPNSFVASSYDDLADAPVEAGNFEEFDFDNDGARFRVAADARSYDQNRVEDYLQRITGYELQLMGGPPFKEYTFLLRMGGSHGEFSMGGMEHANSAAISAGSMGELLELSAHEFFHAWNVKRIRPKTLGPVDYAREQYTRALWFAEGVTSTYAAYTLERTHLWTKDEFYDDLGTQITDLESRPARKSQSVEDSSLDAWLEKYDAYLLPDRSISYYNKGQILGVLLDLAIREATDNRKSLDDVMRLMNDEYAKQHRFYNDSEGIRAVVEEVSRTSFADFFRRYVAGVDDIPYDEFLAAAGLRLDLHGVGGVGAQYSIVEIPHPTDRQLRIREGLLRGTTN
jgi:predicted metalloprotease with PDZ domain